MSDELSHALDRLFNGRDLTASEMHGAMAQIMEGDAGVAQIAALLSTLKLKGEAVPEIVGAAQAMRERATPIPCNTSGLMDTCGTGGDELCTFNISTATALVVAAAGVPVAKHGNRSVSSSSGSADVLEHLGINISISPEQVAECVDELGIGFCFAPLFHRAMKHAAPVRKELGFRTIFNLLGPLVNPAGAEFQLLGTHRRSTAEKLAQALAELGQTRSLVVCGNDELDEVCLWGPTTVFRVDNRQVTTDAWTADDFGLPSCRVDDLRVSSPDQSAQVIRNICSGATGPARDIILANSSAALLTVGRVEDLKAGVKLAPETIDNGRVTEICRLLAERTNR